MKREYKITALGEILWDMLPGGKKLGGAPGNFGWHAQQLGNKVTLISRVGCDTLGDEAISLIRNMGLSTNFIQRDEKHPTGQAVVELSASGSPTFRIVENSAWDFLALDEKATPCIVEADVVYFGSLAQRCRQSRETIQHYLKKAQQDTLRIFDINLRPPFFNDEVLVEGLELANAIKLNDQELPVLSRIFGFNGDVREQLQQLARKCQLKFIAYTRGAEGSLLWANDEWSDYRGEAVDVVDSVGAGDSFTAALVTGYLRGDSLNKINQHANRVASYVCTQHGATPELPVSLIENTGDLK